MFISFQPTAFLACNTIWPANWKPLETCAGITSRQPETVITGMMHKARAVGLKGVMMKNGGGQAMTGKQNTHPIVPPVLDWPCPQASGVRPNASMIAKQ